MKDLRIGFIGLGIMGGPMAGHLADAQYALTVLDVDDAAVARLRARSPAVQVATTPHDLARAADVVFTMLPSGREVREVTLGTHGLLAGLQPGTLLVDTSSSEPWITRELAEALGARGIGMVDAPVSGAEAGAIAAELVFMAGGTVESIARVRPLLEIMGQRLFHLGPVGSGHVMKTVNNLITAVTFMALGEGLLIGTKSGLDPAVMNDVLNESTGMSWLTRAHIAQRIISRRFDDPFKLALMMKDVNIAMQVARQVGFDTPLCSAAQLLWAEADRQTGPGGSVSELMRWLERKAGVQIATRSAANDD